MRSAWMASPATWIAASFVLGGLAMAGSSCSDALHLELPPAETTGGSGGTTATGGTAPVGGGGAAPQLCTSSSECTAPESVCDTTLGVCVECLQFSDCALRPGTVCSGGHCVCPVEGESWCEPNTCANLDTSSVHCGQCGHACFGPCVGGACVDAWEPTATDGAPAARSQHTAVWTGTEMVVWGGANGDCATCSLGDGGIYDPATRTWRATNPVNAPSARRLHTAVWTGSEMLVWGGYHGSAVGTGARFNPADNTWLPMTSISAPAARYYHTAIWTGQLMIVWGGTDGTDQLSSGAWYDPAADQWTAIPAPTPGREGHSAVWDGASLMLIYGGIGDEGTAPNSYLPFGTVAGGSQYNTSTSLWTSINTTGQPSSRAYHTAVMLGTSMVVWGGYVGGTDPAPLGTGAVYKSDGSWTATSVINQPAPRRSHTAVVIDGTPPRMIVWGGLGASADLDSGASYDAGADLWTPIPTALSARREHTAVSTSPESATMIVWGGNSGGTRLATGGVYTVP